MNPRKTHIKSLFGIALIVMGLLPPDSVQAQELTSSEIIELAMSSPVIMEVSTARLSYAIGELESARRWWLPTSALGVQSFARTGSAMNVVGEVFTGVEAFSSAAAWELRFNANTASGVSGVKAAEHSYDATLSEVKSERDRFVLMCVEAYIGVVAANRDLDYHLTAVEELKVYESQYENLFELGLRPESDVFIARSERLQMESKSEELRASIEFMTSELRYVLGLSSAPSVSNVWPEVATSIVSDSYNVLPERKALSDRSEVARQKSKAISRDLYLPELRFSPTLSGFGQDYSNLASTTEWVASIAWTFPLSNLFPGGEKRKADAVLDLAYAEESKWDLRNSAYLDGLAAQISSLKNSLESATLASSVADRAMSDVLVRQSYGLVEPLELLQIERQRLSANSQAISVKEALLIAEFRHQLASGAVWAQ
jgi:outer membrane protein TolC